MARPRPVFCARGAPPPLRGSAALGSRRSPSFRLRNAVVDLAAAANGVAPRPRVIHWINIGAHRQIALLGGDPQRWKTQRNY